MRLSKQSEAGPTSNADSNARCRKGGVSHSHGCSCKLCIVQQLSKRRGWKDSRLIHDSLAGIHQRLHSMPLFGIEARGGCCAAGGGCCCRRSLFPRAGGHGLAGSDDGDGGRLGERTRSIRGCLGDGFSQSPGGGRGAQHCEEEGGGGGRGKREEMVEVGEESEARVTVDNVRCRCRCRCLCRCRCRFD